MDKQELERRLEAAEEQNLRNLDEIKNLKEKLADMQDEPEIPDFPEFKETGEETWHINNVLEVSTPGSTMGKVNDYNYFHSKEYADEFAKKCKLISMMLHCKWYIDRDFVPDWKDGVERKFIIFYNNCANEFGVTIRTTSDVGYVAFSNEESARKCADWLNEHWKDNENE